MRAPQTRKLKVDLSADVRERLARDAEEQETSIQNVAVGILADHFGVAFAGSGRRGPGARKTEAGQVLLNVPVPLWTKARRAAELRPTGQRSMRNVVEAIFRSHYQLDADPVIA